MEDAILYLLHRAYSHLDKESGAVRIAFFDFSSAFNTIQLLLLRDELTEMMVDPLLVTWITDYLTERPQSLLSSSPCIHLTSSITQGSATFRNTRMTLR